MVKSLIEISTMIEPVGFLTLLIHGKFIVWRNCAYHTLELENSCKYENVKYIYSNVNLMYVHIYLDVDHYNDM